MSYPFIIWTMQGTGGSSLADLLMGLSEHPKSEHEPFNRDRQFGSVTISWDMNRDEGALLRAVADIFPRQYLINHTYDLHNKRFNAAIMRAAANAGYRHIFLRRRNEFSRLLCKFLAEANGAWFEEPASPRAHDDIRSGSRKLGRIPVNKMIIAYRRCQDMTNATHAALSRLGVDLHAVHYEDLYTGEQTARLARLEQIFEFLGFARKAIEDNRAAIDKYVLAEAQDTRSIAQSVLNLSKVIKALSAAGCEPPPGIAAKVDGAARKRAPRPAAAKAQPAPAAGAAVEQAKLRSGPWNIKLVWELQRLAAKHAAIGPFLEIGSNLLGPAILSGDYFAGKEKHGLEIDSHRPSNEMTTHQGKLLAVGRQFKDGYFSTVFSNAVLEYDPEFWNTLQEIRRLLAPGGILMIAVPGFRERKKGTEVKVVGARGNPVRQATPTIRIHGPSDYWRFSPRAVREVILKGFEIREFRPLGPLGWLIGVGAKPA